MINSIKVAIVTLAFLPMLALGMVAMAPTTAHATDPSDETVKCNKNNVNISGGVKCAKSADQKGSLSGVIQDVTNVLLFVIGAVAVIMIIIGGIRYTTSNGDSNQVTAAKNTILYGVIGVIVALLAFAIVSFVVGAFTQQPAGAAAGAASE